MGLGEVKERVLEDAREEAGRILAQARTDAEEILLKASAEVNNHEKKAREHNQELLAGIEKKLLAAARVDAQRLLLTTKKEQIDLVMKFAEAEFSTMNGTTRKKFLNSLLKKAKQEIKVAQVLLNKQDKSLLTGIKTKETDITGGLVAENKDGSISVNLSVEELLHQIRQTELVKVSEVLFG